MSLNDFKNVKRLGDGAYSQVFLVHRIVDGQVYALKKVKMGKLSDKEKENALNEVRILASIQHANICAYHEAFIDEASHSLCIVMEYANNGDLFQKISKHQKEQTYFKEDDVWRIFIQVVKGLKSLHDAQIFHRDLKSANVFLNKDGSAKLGDMNVSKVAKKGLLYTQTGTPYYASPEVWRDQPYDIKSDIWSLGCVLYESITLRPPFRADDMAGLYRKVLRGLYTKIPDHFSADLAFVVKQLVQVQAQLRPSCDGILQMPAVTRMGEKLFGDKYYDDVEPANLDLLSTIRVPKNLLYLTDRLPKPMYESSEKLRNRSHEHEELKRRTHDGSDSAGNLPELTSRKNNAQQQSQHHNHNSKSVRNNQHKSNHKQAEKQSSVGLGDGRDQRSPTGAAQASVANRGDSSVNQSLPNIDRINRNKKQNDSKNNKTNKSGGSGSGSGSGSGPGVSQSVNSMPNRGGNHAQKNQSSKDNLNSVVQNIISKRGNQNEANSVQQPSRMVGVGGGGQGAGAGAQQHNKADHQTLLESASMKSLQSNALNNNNNTHHNTSKQGGPVGKQLSSKNVRNLNQNNNPKQLPSSNISNNRGAASSSVPPPPGPSSGGNNQNNPSSQTPNLTIEGQGTHKQHQARREAAVAKSMQRAKTQIRGSGGGGVTTSGTGDESSNPLQSSMPMPALQQLKADQKNEESSKVGVNLKNGSDMSLKQQTSGKNGAGLPPPPNKDNSSSISNQQNNNRRSGKNSNLKQYHRERGGGQGGHQLKVAALMTKRPNEMSDSGNDYEGDDFERDELVQMAEPRPPTIPHQQPVKKTKQTYQKRNRQAALSKINDKATTNDTTVSRGQGGVGGSDSNSLLREISIRNKKASNDSGSGNNHSSSAMGIANTNNAGGSSVAGGGPSSTLVPQLKQVNRPRHFKNQTASQEQAHNSGGLISSNSRALLRDQSKDSLISARRQEGSQFGHSNHVHNAQQQNNYHHNQQQMQMQQQHSQQSNNKDYLMSNNSSQPNLHSHRMQHNPEHPIYKSHNQSPLKYPMPLGLAGRINHHHNHHQNGVGGVGAHHSGDRSSQQYSMSNNHHNIHRKPRVNYPGNMAYINISQDGQRLVGPLGLKKAEQELIKRRYKYHYNQDSISRVALVYGQSSTTQSTNHHHHQATNNSGSLHLRNSYQVGQNSHNQQNASGGYDNSSQNGGELAALNSMASGGSHGLRGGLTPNYYYAHHLGTSQGSTNSNSSGASPYLQYTRDIQNLYRRQKPTLQGSLNRGDSTSGGGNDPSQQLHSRLPRIGGGISQRGGETNNHLHHQQSSKMLPPIQTSQASGIGLGSHLAAQGGVRNFNASNQLSPSPQIFGVNGGQPSYRSMKNKHASRAIGSGVAGNYTGGGENGGSGSGGRGEVKALSLDRMNTNQGGSNQQQMYLDNNRPQLAKINEEGTRPSRIGGLGSLSGNQSVTNKNSKMTSQRRLNPLPIQHQSTSNNNSPNLKQEESGTRAQAQANERDRSAAGGMLSPTNSTKNPGGKPILYRPNQNSNNGVGGSGSESTGQSKIATGVFSPKEHQSSLNKNSQ